MRHHMSFALRTMSGAVNRKVLEEAADELDRLNNLIIAMTTQASNNYSEHKQQLAALETRIRELEHAVGTTARSDR